MPQGIEEESLGDQFEQNGYESINAIRNMGSSFLYLVFLLFILLVLSLTKILK